MNRGGLQGAAFELDDRFTAYDARSIVEGGLDGGKMLVRIDPAEPDSVATLEACANAVTDLARHARAAMIEPLVCRRGEGRVVNDLSSEAVIRSVAIASGIGATSAYTWLKLPVIDDMERVMAATTLPTLLLGGDPTHAPDETYAAWERALAVPGVTGLVVGRALLYPRGDDVEAAVDEAVRLCGSALLPNSGRPLRRLSGCTNSTKQKNQYYLRFTMEHGNETGRAAIRATGPALRPQGKEALS